MRKKYYLTGIVIIFFMLAMDVFASEKAPGDAERLMRIQVEAVKDGHHQRFLTNGNQAFRSLMDKFTFDSLKMQHQRRLEKGYKLKYLGAIKRAGMTEYIWRVELKGVRYELLGSITLSSGKVAGFDLQ
ncbi:MAG: hypothetical protein JSV21_09320 [Nitrospirota bacterium]|nr:MAG: hypothetical protein JSV21_09320 [Nitrospirota bacterium]